jgi:hypothetical protein
VFDYGDEMLRIKDRQNREMLYGPTNEELITEIFRSSVKSYKSLPQLLYHIQWKFRDELRPRFGIMRCREFYMKDAYSFDINDEEALFSYNKFFLSYLRTFKRLELTAIPMEADTGPIGGNLSHEFIILAETGESKIFTDKRIFELDSEGTKIEKKSLEELRKKYPNEWNCSWKNDAFLGYAYDVILNYGRRFIFYKKAFEKASLPPPQLLIALAGCCWAPGIPPITEEEAISLVKKSLSDKASSSVIGGIPGAQQHPAKAINNCGGGKDAFSKAFL